MISSYIFKRKKVLLRKKESLVTIPVKAIVDVFLEGFIFKKLVVFVDDMQVKGKPKKIFKVRKPMFWEKYLRGKVGL